VSERTVTEQQVIDAMNKHGIEHRMAYFEVIWDELFPELPAHNELIKVWNVATEPGDNEVWRRFKKMTPDGDALTYFGTGSMGVQWANYRRQTPVERGEG
jgi:hypothetical protein